MTWTQAGSLRDWEICFGGFYYAAAALNFRMNENRDDNTGGGGEF